MERLSEAILQCARNEPEGTPITALSPNVLAISPKKARLAPKRGTR